MKGGEGVRGDAEEGAERKRGRTRAGVGGSKGAGKRRRESETQPSISLASMQLIKL